MDKGGVMIKLAKKGNKKILSISRKDWEYIGKIAGWKDKAKDTAKGLWSGITDVYNSMPQGPNDDVFSLQTKIDPKGKEGSNQDAPNPSSAASSESSLYSNIPSVGDKVICTKSDGGTVEGVLQKELAGGMLEIKLDGYMATIEQFEKSKVKKKI